MRVGRAIGYGLLALVDAMIPTVVALVIVGFALVGRTPASVSGATVTLAAAVATFGLTLLASTVSHYRGGSPFAFTRLAKTVVHYWLFWPPWAWTRRRRR